MTWQGKWGLFDGTPSGGNHIPSWFILIHWTPWSLNRRGWKLKPSKPFCWWVFRDSRVSCSEGRTWYTISKKSKHGSMEWIHITPKYKLVLISPRQWGRSSLVWVCGCMFNFLGFQPGWLDRGWMVQCGECTERNPTQKSTDVRFFKQLGDGYNGWYMFWYTMIYGRKSSYIYSESETAKGFQIIAAARS